MKPRVLIVDDEPDITHLLEFNLRAQGCEPLCANNGLQGLRLARMEMPDVVLLDILLPDLDGLAVAEILHRQPSTRGIPVFMLSALSESFARHRKVSAHYELFFTKPVDMALLASSIRRAARARHDKLSGQLNHRETAD